MVHHEGSVEVVCGSMFSGKTEELIRRLKRAAIARQKIQVLNLQSMTVTMLKKLPHTMECFLMRSR